MDLFEAKPAKPKRLLGIVEQALAAANGDAAAAGAIAAAATAKACAAVWKSKFYGAFVLNHRVVLHAIDATPA